MLDGEKNLNDLLFFAQSLIKDIELKKKEIVQQDQDENPNDKSPTRPNLTSFKAERDKALRYKEWKRSFCEEGPSRDRLARSVDRLNEVETEWVNQKRAYQHKAMNMSLYSDAQLFTELESSPQKKASRCGSVRGSRWDEKPSSSKNSYSSLNRIQKAYYSRSSSQGCMDKESASKQNSGTKEAGNSKAFMQRKGSIGTPKNNDSMQRTNSYQSLHSSQKKVETPVSKSKTIFGDSSPNKKDYLKRKSYSIQRQISLEAGNPSASTNFSASTINSARQQNESISAVDNKFESLFMSGKGEEPKRGRQASPKRGIPSTTGTESPVVPIVSKINLGDWTKHSIELKEKSHRGYKEQNDSSSIWSSEKLIVSLKARAGLGDAPQPQPNLTNLKELFPADSKPSARAQAAGDTTEEGSASPSKSVKYSILKEKPQLNDSREINSSRLNNSCRSETKKPSRSSSCHQDKEQPSSARNRNKSPVSSRDKIASIQVQEDLKLLESNKSIEKWKKSREASKEITCEVIDLRAEKEKLYKDILDKLHSQKQKSKGKSKQIWLY